jgi:predicted Zn-dependent peptidase
MNPRSMQDFFSIMCGIMQNNINVKNLETYKKRAIIENKLAGYLKKNVVKENILSCINRKMIFNAGTLLSINENDVRSFFHEKYRNCPMTIIVCGAVGYKNLIKSLQISISNMPDRKARAVDKLRNIDYREIAIANKYIANSVMYGYFVPREENHLFGSVFAEVMKAEIFRFLCRSRSMLHKFYMEDVFNCNDIVHMVSLYPKNDISIDQVQRIYNTFVKRLSLMGIEPERLSEIATFVKLKCSVCFSDLYQVYDCIKNAYLAGQDINFLHTLPDIIKTTNPDHVKSFADKILRHNLIIKMITRFKLDD